MVVPGGLKFLMSEVPLEGRYRVFDDASLLAAVRKRAVIRIMLVIVLVRSHAERRCSILGPTQSHISPSILVYEDKQRRASAACGRGAPFNCMEAS